jgi:DNA-binding GntR family transcriptional regulator
MSIHFKTKSEAAYETIRTAILNRKYKAGEKIQSSKLAAELGISEIPIRESIKKLESDGLLQTTPHVGTVVCKIDAREYIEILMIKTELEAFATKLATPYITEADLKFLEEKNQEMALALSENDLRSFSSSHKEFHFKIYDASPYPYLYRLIVDLWEKSYLAKDLFCLVPQRAYDSQKEHRNLVDAIRSKNAILAERIVRKQKKRAVKSMIKYMEEERNNSILVGSL